ncbi:MULTISPECIES: hypothetical protein [Bacillus subtilis group]|nr:MULTISPECIES: hypothetical protein [Bacillus subtilis group]MCT6515525.1 hypothetical protein [Bacillus subtilis]MCV4329357.1 hypothetical protein [Bacillus velezensis]MEC0383813.1 hypothetical protein [Bacillus velezensis]MEC0389200.1 hypothetical protein [Bacillus velezensis]WBY47993.1 hypothetical protein PF996_21455 [Bacillus velezensis]
MKLLKTIKEIVFWLFIFTYVFGVRTAVSGGIQEALDILIIISVVCSLIVFWIKSRQA